MPSHSFPVVRYHLYRLAKAWTNKVLILTIGTWFQNTLRCSMSSVMSLLPPEFAPDIHMLKMTCELHLFAPCGKFWSRLSEIFVASKSCKAYPSVSYIDEHYKGIFNIVLEQLRFQRKFLLSAEQIFCTFCSCFQQFMKKRKCLGSSFYYPRLLEPLSLPSP